MPRPIAELSLVAGTYIENAGESELVQQTFDSYLARAAAQPTDSEAFDGLRSLMVWAVESGEADFVMRNAMLLAATACADPHLESLASEAGNLVDSSRSRGSHNDYDHEDLDGSPKAENLHTKNRKSKKRIARSLSDLIFSLKFSSKTKLLSLGS